jgi:transketolase
VTVEDNYTGGLDAELAMAIARTGSGVRLTPMYVQQIPKSGRTPEEVLDYLGIDAAAIAKAVR